MFGQYIARLCALRTCAPGVFRDAQEKYGACICGLGRALAGRCNNTRNYDSRFGDLESAHI